MLARRVLEGDTGQREQLAAWDRALLASGLPLGGLDAVPPRARFASAAPLSASMPGEAELADIWLTERVPAWRVREALAASVPAGYVLREIHDVWLGAPPLPGQVVASVYRATFTPHESVSDATVEPAALAAACAAMLAASAIPRERPKGQTTIAYDLRPFVDALVVDAAGRTLRMTLRHDPERGIGRPEEVLAELGERLGRPLAPATLAREGLVLAPPPVLTPAAPRPRGRPRPPGTSPGRPRR